MTVEVISQDPKLHQLYDAVRDAVPDANQAVAEPHDADRADVCVIDFEPGADIPPAVLRNPLAHLFLVDRKNIAALQSYLGQVDANILLKPVSEPILAAFLGSVFSADAERVSLWNGTRADRDEILQSLIQASLKLQKSDQDRTNFLARALHDFAPPLTTISGYCDLLVNEVLGSLNDDQKEVLRRMIRSTRRLSRMACAMYELSVGRHLPLPVDRREGSIEDCIDHALRDAEPLLSAKRVFVVPNVDSPSGPLAYDSGLVEQVLANLLENACKFTAKGGTIELRGYPFFWERRNTAVMAGPATGDRRRVLSRRPNAYRVDILNEGPPIPDESIKGLFQEHTSYAGGQDRSGGGLGLAICRMHIARHDGRIWAENRDSGPLVSFVLPLKHSKATLCATSAVGGNCERQGTRERDHSPRRSRA